MLKISANSKVYKPEQARVNRWRGNSVKCYSIFINYPENPVDPVEYLLFSVSKPIM